MRHIALAFVAVAAVALLGAGGASSGIAGEACPTTCTTLTEAASAGDTHVHAASTDGFDPLSSHLVLEPGTANEETLRIEAVAGDEVTVHRALEIAHANGASVQLGRPGMFYHGDINCDTPGFASQTGTVDSTDGLAVLRGVAHLGVTQMDPCPNVGSAFNPILAPFGDVTCDGFVDSLDALAILRYVAHLPVPPPPLGEGCPPLGAFLLGN